MAVLTRPCSVFHCANSDTQHSRSLQNGRPFKSACNFVRTQLCTIALSLTLFNSNRLPREAFQYGSVPYLVIYSFWLLAVGFPTILLQLSVGQLSQQDVAGVWRAVPILRGVGHLKYLTSYICCIYNMLNVALVAAYIIWIGKGTFPLKDCTKIRMTPRGYENKMNASECFNSTFLSPFPETPQYLGIMAILIFVLWFFLPIFLYRLRRTLTVALSILVPITIICAIVLSTFLSRNVHLASLFESCEQWTSLYQPFIWFSAMVQALMSTHIVGGYLITAGSTVYRHSDVRVTSSTVITANLIAGWLWVLLWESIGGNMKKDQSFVTIPLLIYQSSVVERRTKQWPILAFGTMFLSGVITVITLLYPVYDKIHRLTGDSWRLFASASSAVGTALTVVLLAKGLDIVSLLDSIVLPILSVFTTTIEIVGFVFIYGWYYLAVDIEFLTGSRLPCTWIATWWMAPVFLIGVTGWWLRALLRATVSQPVVQFSLLGIMVVILATMLVFAAIAVAKEEQYNLLSKIASAFKPSRLWGPEEPMARYVWMSQRYAHALSTGDTNSDIHHYSDIILNTQQDKYDEDYLKRRTYTIHTKKGSDDEATYKTDLEYSNYSLPRGNKKILGEEKFRSPNICVAKSDLGDNITCNCNRHFKLDIPNLKSCEVTTIL